MKIYVVVTDDHYNGNAPAESKLGCKIFIDKQKAKNYYNGIQHKYPIRWGGPYIHVEMFEKNI